MRQFATTLLFCLFTARSHAFTSTCSSRTPTTTTRPHILQSSRVSNLETTIAYNDDKDQYNVSLEQAAQLWTVSVVAQDRGDRQAGVPFLDVTKTPVKHFVDDVSVVVSREGGLGLELLELAGGRDDGYGLTMVEAVSGNAQAAGVLPGDSIAAVQWVQERTVSTTTQQSVEQSSLRETVSESTQTWECECRDFDGTMDIMRNLPAEATSVVLQLKRVRTWPTVQVVVEYPPSQCAPGVDPTETYGLLVGEQLRQGLLTRGVVMEDGMSDRQCDFCGSKACTVLVQKGMALLSEPSLTETKIMKYNPGCRISCKATLKQPGEMKLRLNVNEWNRGKDKK